MKANYKKLIIALATAFLIVAVVLIGLYKIVLNPFGAHTYVGPFDVSHLSTGKARDVLTEQVATLKEKEVIELIYQDYSFSLPDSVVKYDVNATLEQAQSHADNGLVVAVDPVTLQQVLQKELPISLTENDQKAIEQQLKERLELGIMPVRIEVAEQLETPERLLTTVAAVEGNLPSSLQESKSLTLFDELPEMILEPRASFSFLAFLEQQQLPLFANEEYSYVASLLYEAALHTDLLIEKRSIKTVLQEGIKIGYEASIHYEQGSDLIMHNPHAHPIQVQVERRAQELHVRFITLPYYYTYAPQVGEVILYAPKTILREAKGKHGVGRVLGRAGEEVTVMQRITKDGTFIDEVEKATDFYSPTVTIDYVKFLPPGYVEPTTPNPVRPPAERPEQSNPNGASSEDGAVKKGNSSTESGTTKDRPNHSTDVQYDKAGNIVQP